MDKTRVKVSPISNDPISTDYVNANFVKVKVKFEYLIIEKSGNRIYIASQAPLPNTFGDFFRMIWENNCEIIIMLTRWIENGKVKFNYFFSLFFIHYLYLVKSK